MMLTKEYVGVPGEAKFRNLRLFSEHRKDLTINHNKINFK